ncbi:MAG TPA: DUF3261 domain-containing protein [Polyangia bacterium]|nr:DUF3261 domain-containing protein [Polyangia bacterium]
MKKSTIVLFFLLTAACRPPARALQPLPLDDGWETWKTLEAEQRVTIDAPRAGGKREHRTLRCVIAVERPDKFRLRAMGPGGITLFDLVGRGGKISVLESLRDPANPTMHAILESLAGDVQAVYGLGGLGEKSTNVRAFLREGDHRVARDAEREVRIWPAHVEIDNRARGYRVAIDSQSQRLDGPLDPALFDAAEQ